MRDYLEIFKRNLLSPIVIAIALLAGALIYVHEYRDAWFISVVIVVNSLIGIVQELRAKRALNRAEIDALPVLCRGAALRFLLTRLVDWLNVPPGALVRPLDPMEYFKKLRFHQSVSAATAYGLVE